MSIAKFWMALRCRRSCDIHPSCRAPNATSLEFWWEAPFSGGTDVFTSLERAPVPRSARCYSVLPSRRNYEHALPLGQSSGRKVNAEKLWWDFFSDPSQWWDNRSEKVNRRYPDFKHKKTKQALWLDNGLTPPWVEAKLAALATGILQSDIFSWNKRLERYVKAGNCEEAMELFQQMQREGMEPDAFTFVRALNACSKLRALEQGRHIYRQIVEAGYESDPYVGSSLINMYSKCGSIEDARRVFDRMPTRDVVAWGAMVGGYVKCGEGQNALELCRQMQEEGINPNPVIFVGVLNACASLAALDEGRRVHELIIARDLESDVFVGSSLIDMYVKCGSIEDARRVFDKMPTRNVVAWNAVLVGYVKSGQGQEALDLSQQMEREGVDPSPVTFVGLLNASASVAALKEGRRIHEQIIERGYESDVYVCNCLVDMYAKCGSMEEARRVFNNMPTRDLVAWNAVLMGYVKCGKGRETLKLYGQMQLAGVNPDPFTFVALLNACASLLAIEEGRQVHEQIVARGYNLDAFVGNCLIDMYAKCGSIDEARHVFNKMPTRDLVAWAAMIAGYVKCGEVQEALQLYQQMQKDGVNPDRITFVSLINACASAVALEEGRRVHEQIIQRGYESDAFVGSGLVDMYSKCGSIVDARLVFNQMPTRDMVASSAMLVGYVKCGESQEALELSRQMLQEGMDLDPATFVAMLNACASIAALEEGKHVHEHIIERGYESDIFVGSSLVDMYAKCGSMEDARRVFNKMPMRNVVTWGALVIGYVNCGEGHKALDLFQQMERTGLDPDPATFVGLLKACASIATLEEGRRIHKQILERGYESDVSVGNCLVDMYAKCGSIEDARLVFNKMPAKDVVTWNSMLAAYGTHGYAREALEHFKQMGEVVDVNVFTFTSLLSACSHVGLVDEGLYYFESMSAVYNTSQNVEHYACVVDLLCRAGRLHEAEDLIRSMAFEPCVSVWMSLLGACRTHGNVEMGSCASKATLELDSENDGGYVQPSNMYVAAGK